MDRLTHRYLHGGYWASIFKVSACGENECKGEIIDRLAAYENAEELGLLLRLPCKVGDTVWKIKAAFSYLKKPTENIIDRIIISNNQVLICCTSGAKFSIDSFGETVFLTHEAAEKALTESEDKND